MTKTSMVSMFAVLLAGTGCKKDESSSSATGTGSAAPTGSTPTAGSGAAAETPAAAPSAGPIELAEGLSTPESVLYDATSDVYLVSNINGVPTEADDNGYISKVSPDGKLLEAKWIDGAKPDVQLDAPKGSAIVDGVLWVADITNVRRFDAASGAPKGDIAIEGAAFLNDVTPDGKGGVFVTDTGVNGKFEPTGADAVYHITADGKVTPLVKSKDLGGPNGIAAGADGSVWVVTFGSGELYQVTAKGEKLPSEKLPKGQLDGIVALDGGDLLVSSWEGKVVFRGKPGGPWTEVVTNVEAPADIGWDGKRARVLVPLFTANKVQAHPIK